ncbi:nucleotide sugar dehydrogenase [Peterkaempfera sp. SMS 1(5)a]|uniref:nucleotide sugar dehydrogenase n=1 Tax=Peterkaempfera podocarpi TaxID=3232308 RepID=UPI003670317D
MRVVIAGQGYVGLPLAVRAAEVGYDVVGYDVDERRIKKLAVGESYVEDIPAERLRPLLHAGSYTPSTDPRDAAGFDIAVITVPTPLRDGAPDLSYIEASARMLARFLRPGATVVLESTTYPGTTEELLAPLLEEGSGLTVGRDFHLGYSPERIDPGNPTWRLENTPKVVSGVDAGSLAAVEGFYGQLVERTVPVSSCKEAELTKLLENTFRHVNIALVNELAMFAHDLGIDVWEAIDAASTKPFGYLRFTPGPGVGGHCLPIDPSYLSWRVERALGHPFRFVELANDVNSHMPDYVVRRLVEALNERQRSVKGSRVLLLGLAYKKNTGDARETPAARIAELLDRLGADVRAADPHVVAGVHVDEPPMDAAAVRQVPGPRPGAAGGGHGDALATVRRVEATPAELAAADAVVLLADHDDFDFEAVTEHSRYVLDCRRRLSGASVEVL